MSFSQLGLSPLILKAVEQQGYTTPSPIQMKAIPEILKGSDVMAAAQTGTGKTAGFTLPLLEILSKGQSAEANQARVLILTPTRELAAQVAENVAIYSQFIPLKSVVVYGGVKINPQMMKLRRGADILIATPGRLLDLYQQNAVKFKFLEALVLDEADRMLDMGFIHDIKKIINILPKERQTLMFSATFSEDIRQLAKGLVKNPVEISVSPPNSAVKTITHWLAPVDKKRKPALLSHLIKSQKWQQVLVFSRTKHGANKLTRFLEEEGFLAAAIHGNKSQGARTKALADFKQGETQILVATDIAARGIDIDQLPHVVNFDLPNIPEDYVHRIGRTGRAGASGQAVSLVSADEFKQLMDIERLLKKSIERRLIDDFEPSHEVPKSPDIPRSLKSMKPKKPKSEYAKRTEHMDGQKAGQSRHKFQQANPHGQNKSAAHANGKVARHAETQQKAKASVTANRQNSMRNRSAKNTANKV